MATVNEWINADPRRRAPEFDFGTQWTREHDPNIEWAVTYNTGTGELYARTRIGDDVEVLARFADPQDVADAVPEWGRRSMQAGSLDWITRELHSMQHRRAGVAGNDSIYGVVLSSDGNTDLLREPPSIGDVAVRIGEHLDVARVNTADPTGRVVMWVDDFGHDQHLPVNAVATQLYGTGWPILGDAVVVSDDQSPLPQRLLTWLELDQSEPDLDRAPSRALEWEDRHRDLERPDRDLDVDLDVDVDVELDLIDDHIAVDGEEVVVEAELDIDHELEP